MRRARVTYCGAYHHIMNRGIQGEKIFGDERAKQYFLKALEEKTRKLRISILAYCIMNNHYHLIAQNTSGRLSDFMKQLNGQYGIYYRSMTKTKGYVFQNRYKSTLVQEDRYLKQVIIYALLNPVRAAVVKDPYAYKWSSIGKYFTKEESFINAEEVEDIFESKEKMREYMSVSSGAEDVEITKTSIGSMIGDKEFIRRAEELFNRRNRTKMSARKRVKDYIFIPAEEVIKEFERRKGINIEKINTSDRTGKKLRDELLIRLKDEAGLNYSEIIKIQIFRHLKYNSLGAIYNRAKKNVIL
ncbi:MAG: transposase [bacterium]